MKLSIYFRAIFFCGALCQLSVFALQNIVLVAPPGAGKGTFAQYLVRTHDHVQICPGDLFRDHVARGTELGKQIKPIMDSGNYVDENITSEVLFGRLAEVLAEKKKFIIDGYPTSEYTFERLCFFLSQHNLISCTRFIRLVADDETCIKRIQSRQICLSCYSIYNSVTAQPKVQGICDCCNTLLTIRPADTCEIARKRLEIFHKKHNQLLPIIESRYGLKVIDAECDVNDLAHIYENLIK